MNANGKVLKETGIANFCPFLYQGQSYDAEIELAYNRFRYYDVEDGRYISQDPIGLHSRELGFYNYVEDTNKWVDRLGLAKGGVYALVDEDGVVKRTGRTKDLKKRKADHKNDKDLKHLEFVELYKTDDYNTQRGLEHKVYTENEVTAHKDNGGFNKIKAISDSNGNKDTYIKAGADFLNTL